MIKFFVCLGVMMGLVSVGWAEVAAVVNSEGDIIIQPGFENQVTALMKDQLFEAGPGARLFLEGSGHTIQKPSVSPRRTAIPQGQQVVTRSLPRTATTEVMERTPVPDRRLDYPVTSVPRASMTRTQAGVVETYSAAGQAADSISPQAARSAERITSLSVEQESRLREEARRDALTAAKIRQMDANTTARLQREQIRAQESAHKRASQWVDQYFDYREQRRRR